MLASDKREADGGLERLREGPELFVLVGGIDQGLVEKTLDPVVHLP
jgi:hypothetical protein